MLYSPTQHGINYNKIHQIITIHDLIPLFYPSGRWHQYMYYRFILPKVIKNSDKIITISNNTKKDIIRYYNVDVNKINVIYNGCNKPKLIDKEKSIKYIYNKYKIKDYLLMVGINYKYKNLHSVIEAYSNIIRRVNNKLVIVGNCNNSYGKKLIKLVKKLRLNKDVIFLGYVNDYDLEKLYQAAKIFIYPSLYEGFGLPILEASANDTMVITSQYSSIPEIGQGISIMINTNNLTEIQNSLLYWINNTEKFFIDKKKLKKFNWNLTVKKIYEIMCLL